MPLPAWFPYVLIGLAIAFAIGFAVYYFRDDDDEEGDADAAGDSTLLLGGDTLKEDPLSRTAQEFRTRKSRMISLTQSLEDSLKTREGVAQSNNRFTLPWFLLVGADGSGKSTLLANIGLALPFGPPIEVDATHRDAGRWWLFEDAVMLEAPPPNPDPEKANTLAPGQAMPSAGWNTLLHLLRRERPDSPLNGIVVTVACADLIGARSTPEQVAETAERIRGFLDRARMILGVRLPVHILVTKCDVLPGFKSFAEILPEGRRNDIFGWANTANIEKPFEPRWIDEGFKTLKKTLADLYDEVLAAPDEIPDPDGLFVFSHEFADLHEPLRDFISRLITPGERRPPLFFRGMYFSGDMIEHKQAASAEELVSAGTLRMSAEAALAEQTGEEAHHLVFLRSLFKEKVFKEGGLARSATRLRLARDRRVVAAQAAAMLIAFGGGAGLWSTVYGYRQDDVVYRSGLHADAQTLARVLTGVAIDMDEVSNPLATATADTMLRRRSHDAAVIELVDEMRQATPIHKSAFIPSSWLSPVPDQVRRAMIAGIQHVVLPVSRARLEERTRRLLSPSFFSAEDGQPLDIADPHFLATYLTEWQQLSRNIARYNALAKEGSGGTAELSGLLEYLYAQSPLVDTTQVSSDFEAAINRSQSPAIVVTPAMASAVLRRSVAMVRGVSDAASRQLAARPTPQAERAVKPETDLIALRRISALVEMTDPKGGLVASVTDSGMFGVALAHALEDSINAQLKVAATRIARDTLSADASAARLRRVITALFERRFMEPVEDREVTSELRADQRLRWDVGRLELALALRGEFVQGLVTVGEAFPNQVPDRIRRALEQQLRSRVVDVAASAQRFVSDSLALDDTVEILRATTNLDGAASRIMRLSTLLDTLKAGDQGRRLLVSSERQAERVLALAQREYDRQGFYAPRTDLIAKWQGVVPFNFSALGAGDSLAFATTLYRAEAAVRTLAHNVGPALTYLRGPGMADSLRAGRLLVNWEAVSAQVARFERGDPTSSLAVLRRYIREILGVTDLQACGTLATQPDTARGPADYFEMRRRELRSTVIGRCTSDGSVPSIAAYRRMRALFNVTLAGRFPFVDSTSASQAPDADPAAIREVFRQYDALETGHEQTLRSDPRLGEPAKDAIPFLEQLARVRPFLAPFVDSGTVHRVPEYALLIGSGDEVREEPWRLGDSVVVALAATDSGDTPVFTPGGGWSPLRYVLRHQAGSVPIRFYHPETKLELVVPAFPSTAPDINVAPPPAPRRAAPAPAPRRAAPAPARSTPARTPRRP